MASNDYRPKCLEAKGEECVICGAEENIEVHHIDGDRTNNDLSNLEPICNPHHKAIHNGDAELEEYVDRLNTSSSDSMVQITVRIEKGVLNELDQLADEEGQHRSELIREYIGQGLSEKSPTSAELARVNTKCEQLQQRVERSTELVDRLLEKV